METLTGKLFVESDISTWSDFDYRRLLAEIEPIFNAPNGTLESDRADILFDLIEAYEAVHYSMYEPSPKAIVEYTQVERPPLLAA